MGFRCRAGRLVHPAATPLPSLQVPLNPPRCQACAPLPAARVPSPHAQQLPLPVHPAQTVCTYWLRGMCMKGDQCGFLHQYDVEKMPICRNLLKFGECKELDCPYKHNTGGVCWGERAGAERRASGLNRQTLMQWGARPASLPLLASPL